MSSEKRKRLFVTISLFIFNNKYHLYTFSHVHYALPFQTVELIAQALSGKIQPYLIPRTLLVE